MNVFRNGPPQPKMSKNERRQLFEMKVAQEEKQERQRRKQEELWQQQQQELKMQQLSIEAANYSAQNGFPCYFDPGTQTWLPYTPGSALHVCVYVNTFVIG